MRANLLDELHKPYVETGRAKGLPELTLILRYPVRVALNPFISTVGWVLPTLVSGDVIVATVLSLPTAGPILIQALKTQDQYLGRRAAPVPMHLRADRHSALRPAAGLARSPDPL